MDVSITFPLWLSCSLTPFYRVLVTGGFAFLDYAYAISVPLCKDDLKTEPGRSTYKRYIPNSFSNNNIIY